MMKTRDREDPWEVYTPKPPGGASAQSLTVDSLEADGVWCPMAHATRNDDSFQDLPPLRRVRTFQKISSPIVSPLALSNLGAYSGEAMAVCAYESPCYPALVAYAYQDGSVRWTSPLRDLPGIDRRRVAGVLLAKMGMNGSQKQRYVFAANPTEFVAYAADGTRLWKRPTAEVACGVWNNIGAPTSLRFTEAKELVTVTSGGWVVKLNPMNGRIIDAYRMDTNVVVGGRVYKGTFVAFKSPAVIGNVLYLVVKFKADPSTPLHPILSPVHIVRIELSQPGVPGRESRIKPLQRPLNPRDLCPDRAMIGVHRTGGSPSVWAAPDGRVLIFAPTHSFVNGQRQPVIAAVEDERGVLTKRWWSVLALPVDDDILAAPALHGDSRVLLVPSGQGFYVFRNVDALSGRVPPPSPLSSAELVTFKTRPRVIAKVKARSPMALTFDGNANELVVYMNFRVFPVFGGRTYGFLGAFALSPGGRKAPRPLWCRPLAVTASGDPAPGPGTFGQPALFRYKVGESEETGLIVNTVFTGTYIFK